MCFFLHGWGVFASLIEDHCFTSWQTCALTFQVFSFYCLQESFGLFNADSQPSSTLVLSKCCVGRPCNINMAFIVGWSAGSHSLRSVPVDLTELLPDGRKVLSSDFQSADIFILALAYTHFSCLHRAQISSQFFLFILSPPWLFFRFLLLLHLCDW